METRFLTDETYEKNVLFAGRKEALREEGKGTVGKVLADTSQSQRDAQVFKGRDL